MAAVDLVMPNFEVGIREAVRSLHGLGHRKFVFLAARSQGQRVGKRPALFEAIVGEYDGARVDVRNCGPSIEEAYSEALQFLGGEECPTAVVALNDLTAIGVLRAAKESGLNVPGDLSVVGIDGIPLSEQLWISLSSIVQPHEAMARQAAEFLLSRTSDRSAVGPQRAEFPTHFVERESSGPAPGPG